MDSNGGFNADVTSKAINMLYDDEEVSTDNTELECGIKPAVYDECGNPKFCPNCHLKLSATEKVNRKCYSCEEKF